jgi:hypothetical protein
MIVDVVGILVIRGIGVAVYPVCKKLIGASPSNRSGCFGGRVNPLASRSGRRLDPGGWSLPPTTRYQTRLSTRRDGRSQRTSRLPRGRDCSVARRAQYVRRTERAGNLVSWEFRVRTRD